MMHNAWSSIKEVPYCFSRSSAIFQGHTGQKISSFDLNWAFSDFYSSLNSPMDLKWCTKLDVVQKRCPIIFQDHPPNFQVMRDKKQPFWPEFSVSRLHIQYEFTDGFKMMHRVWRSIEEVPYCSSKSSIKPQDHKGWKIDLNPIWVRLIGRSQLSNPSDLPCLDNTIFHLHFVSFCDFEVVADMDQTCTLYNGYCCKDAMRQYSSSHGIDQFSRNSLVQSNGQIGLLCTLHL